MFLQSVALFGVAFALVLASNCTMKITNKLQVDSVLLCGRTNGGVPGAWYNKSLGAGESFSYPCAQTAIDVSYETYFSVRGDKTCKWDNCNPNTGSCKHYPFILGEGLSWSDGYWYGFIASNFDGGIGWQGNYSSREANYSVSLSCSSYGVTPWKATCGPLSSGKPFCKPNHPAIGFPDSGVVAAGPKNNQGTIEVEIF